MTAIDSLLRAIESGEFPPVGVFADDAVLDATVPNWRFGRVGGAAVSAELSSWFSVAGRFESLVRTPLPDGELIEFVLTWEEAGVPHACHQAHVVTVRDDGVAKDTVFCGGRWPATLLAEMEEAARAAG